MHSKANILILGCGEGNYSIYHKVSSKENGQLVLKGLCETAGAEGSQGYGEKPLSPESCMDREGLGYSPCPAEPSAAPGEAAPR